MQREVGKLDETSAVQVEKKEKGADLNRLKNIMENLLFLFMIAIMAASVFFLFQSRIKGATPSIAGYQMFIVESGSMIPTIGIGSLILIKPVESDCLEVGDIITYKSNELSQTVTHRIVRISNAGTTNFITRGDANNADDPLPVAENQVVGKVVFTIPYIGYAMHFIRTKRGFFTLIILPAAIILLTQFYKLYKLAEEEDSHKQAAEKKEQDGEIKS